MEPRLEESYRKKAERFGKPGSRDLRQLEDIYHKRTSGVYIGDMVFGSNDGIITTFAIVSASVAAHLSPGVIIILGFANLIADGISMGVGSYLGKKSEVDYQRAQRKKEYLEVEEFPDIERHEIGEIFAEWGFEGSDRDRAVEIVSGNKDVWVDFMMMNELGLGPEDKTKPLRHGVTMFGSFFIAGLVPLIPFFPSGSWKSPRRMRHRRWSHGNGSILRSWSAFCPMRRRSCCPASRRDQSCPGYR